LPCDGLETRALLRVERERFNEQAKRLALRCPPMPAFERTDGLHADPRALG
jgi:hypothetical protein